MSFIENDFFSRSFSFSLSLTQKWSTGIVVNNGKVSNRLGHIYVESKRCHLHSIRCSRFERTKQAGALSTLGRCWSGRSNRCAEVSVEWDSFVRSFLTFNFGFCSFVSQATHTWDHNRTMSSHFLTLSLNILTPALLPALRHFGYKIKLVFMSWMKFILINFMLLSIHLAADGIFDLLNWMHDTEELLLDKKKVENRVPISIKFKFRNAVQIKCAKMTVFNGWI